MKKGAEVISFLAGVETFHAIVHAYLGLSKTKVKGHPAELLGINVDPTFHAIAVLLNAAVAVGLGVHAWRSSRVTRTARDVAGATFAAAAAS